MRNIELNKKVTSIEVGDNKIIINLEKQYIPDEGEYFYVKTKYYGFEYIAIKRMGNKITDKYVSVSLDTRVTDYSGRCASDKDIDIIRPATAEEKELLDRGLENRAKKWNPETMQIEDVPKVGDFCIFWDTSKKSAKCAILEEITINCFYPYKSSCGSYANCIKFQSIERFKDFINE
jgi:hypothetical protein